MLDMSENHKKLTKNKYGRKFWTAYGKYGQEVSQAITWQILTTTQAQKVSVVK